MSSISNGKYYLFYHADNPCSNHHIRNFVVKNITFNCVEQFMMYCKAMLFGDVEIAKQILAELVPQKQKMLGRKVKGYVESIWNDKGDNFVYIGAKAKFLQNLDLRAFLLSTRSSILVEASPTDTKWGIGMSMYDQGVFNEANWRGDNRQGRILMLIRQEIQEQEHFNNDP